MAIFTGPKLLKYVSQLDAATIGWTSGEQGDPATVANSSPCSGALTFEQAVLHAHSRGARLPTLSEMLAGAVAGSGCGYDSQYNWCIDMVNGDENNRYVCWGRPASNNAPGGIVYESRAITSTAYVRMVADVDKNRTDPVEIYDRMVLDIIYAAGYSL